jgi:hypothetical protein
VGREVYKKLLQADWHLGKGMIRELSVSPTE